MTMDVRYDLYDTIILTNVAATESQLFKVVQGADATHNEQFTNARGSGQLPNDEKFVVDWIGLIIDQVAITDDIIKAVQSSFLQVVVSDKTLLKAIDQRFIARSEYGGFFAQATAANQAAIGLKGIGYDLREKPITIPGGTSFYLRHVQGIALSVASTRMKVVLSGIYTLTS